jgi:hypothetical protein
LSREVAEYLVPEVHVRPAVEEDVSDNLSPLPTLAAGAGNAWYSPGEKEVIQTDFLSAKLHLQHALSFSESFVELEHFLGGHRCGLYVARPLVSARHCDRPPSTHLLPWQLCLPPHLLECPRGRRFISPSLAVSCPGFPLPVVRPLPGCRPPNE